MKNRNLPRHLRRQLPSAEANFEGCNKAFIIIPNYCNMAKNLKQQHDSLNIL